MESSGSVYSLHHTPTQKPMLPALSMLRKEGEYSGKKRDRAYSLNPSPLSPLKNPIVAQTIAAKDQRSLSMEAVDTNPRNGSITSPQSNDSLNFVSSRSSVSSQSSISSVESGPAGFKQSPITNNINQPLTRQDSFSSSTSKLSALKKTPVKLEPLKSESPARHNSHQIEFHDISKTRSNSTSDPERKRNHKKSLTTANVNKWRDLSATTKKVMEKKKQDPTNKKNEISEHLLQNHLYQDEDEDYPPPYPQPTSPMKRTSSLVISCDKIAKDSSPLFKSILNHANPSSNSSNPGKPSISIPEKQNFSSDHSENGGNNIAPRMSGSPTHFVALRSSKDKDKDTLSSSTGSNVSTGSSSHQTPNSPLPNVNRNSFNKDRNNSGLSYTNSPANGRPSSTPKQHRTINPTSTSGISAKTTPQCNVKEGEILSPDDLHDENNSKFNTLQHTSSSGNMGSPRKIALHNSHGPTHSSPDKIKSSGDATPQSLLTFRFGDTNNEFFHYTESDKEYDAALYQVYIDFRKSVKSKRSYSYLLETLDIYASYWNAVEEEA